MFPGRSETIILLKIALIFPVPARKTALLKSPRMILLLDSIFWKTLSVPANTVTPNSLFLPEDALLSTFPLLKLLYQIFSTQSLSTQGISLQFKTHSLTLFYFHFWLVVSLDHSDALSLSFLFYS